LTFISVAWVLIWDILVDPAGLGRSL